MKESLLKGLKLISGILIFLSFALNSCNTDNSVSLQPIVDSLAAKWVPDTRVALCDIKIKKGQNGKFILTGETTINSAKEDIINTLDKQGIALIDSIIVLPDTVKNSKIMGVVTLSVINLRRHPVHSSELVSQSILGTPVMILKEDGSWILIQTPGKYIAWTEKSSVVPMDQKEFLRWKKAPKIIYTKNSGWLYSSPVPDSDVVGDLVAGCIIERTGESSGYINVILPDGRKGSVPGSETIDFDYFRANIKPDEDNILAKAKSLMGIPYLWGGSSTKGVDCSGFVKSVFFSNGVILMRDASLQAQHGRSIDISDGFTNLKKGDLLFFGSKDKLKSHVTHVAIYMGDNEYINSSGRVMVNSLDSASTGYSRYRYNSLLEARRVIGVENDPGIVPVGKHPWY